MLQLTFSLDRLRLSIIFVDIFKLLESDLENINLIS